MNNLFAGGEEGITVDMDDGPWPRMEAENYIVHGLTL